MYQLCIFPSTLSDSVRFLKASAIWNIIRNRSGLSKVSKSDTALVMIEVSDPGAGLRRLCYRLQKGSGNQAMQVRDLCNPSVS